MNKPGCNKSSAAGVGSKKGDKAMKAKEPMGPEADGETEEEDEEEDEVANKSDMTEDDLQKSLDMLEAQVTGPEGEKETLLKKALDDGLSDEENSRLLELMGGSADQPESLAKSVTASLDPESDERLAKSIDVSEYLDGLHEGMVAAVGELAATLQKSDARQHNFNVVLAKSMKAIGELIKSVDGRLEKVENQPVGNPRALRSPRQLPTLKKSFAGQEGDGEKINKAQVLDELEKMQIESLEKGMGGKARCGESLEKAIAKYETTMRLSRPLYEELMSRRGAAA